MRPFQPLHVALIGVFMFVVLGSTTWLINSWREDSAKERGRDPQAKSVEKPPVFKGKEGAKEPEKPRVDPAVQAEEQARSKARRQAILDLKTEIGETLSTLEQEVIAWETRIPGLLKSEEGKKIAANPARAEQFAGVIEKDRVSKKRVKELRVRLDTLTAPIEQAILDVNTTYYPSDTIAADIKEIGKEAKTKLADFREIRVVIDTLQSDSASTPPGEKTLEKALADMEAERARRRAELVAKAKQDEQDSESKRLAVAAAKAEQDLGNARLELLKAKTDAAKFGIDAQVDDTKRKIDEAKAAEQKRIEKARREAKFDAEYPKLKGYLLPISSPGFKQFGGDGGPRLVMGTTKGPMSLAALTGALRKSTESTGNFARAISNWSDRPQGSFPHYSTGGAGQTPENFEIWYRIQDFIAEFGDIMVERGLLAP